MLLEPPVDISRDDAAREAAKELAKPAYGQAGDNLIARAVGKVLTWITDMLADLTGRSPTATPGC